MAGISPTSSTCACKSGGRIFDISELAADSGMPMTAGSLLGYRRYKVADASPDSLTGTTVFAKDPLGAAIQLYNIYRLEHKRPRTVAVMRLERGQKAIRVERRGNEFSVYYLKGDPGAAVRRMKKKQRE